MKTNTQPNPLFLLSLVALLCSGCAALESGGEMIAGVSRYFFEGEDNNMPPAELVEYEAELEIDVLWEENIGVGADGQFLNLVAVVSHGRIIVADRDGLVQAREVKTGNLIWEIDTDFAFSAGPSIGDHVIILATSNAEVIAFDFASGKQQWISTVSSEVLARPVVAEGIVIIRTSDGKVIALNESDGSENWIFERSVPTLSVRGTGTPIIVNEDIIVGYANGKLINLRLSDGKNNWETSIAIPKGRSEVERLVDLDVDPIETDGVIFISSVQSGTSAVLNLGGDVLWLNSAISSFSGLSYDWRHLYISDVNGQVWQLEQTSGNPLWNQDALSHRRLSAPVTYAEYVVVADYQGYVHWLSAVDGRQLARIKVADEGVDAELVVVSNTVYVYTKDGTLAALAARLF